MAIVLVNKDKIFDNPVGFIPGVLDTSSFPEGLGGLFLTRRNYIIAQQELTKDGPSLQEASEQPIIYTDTDASHSLARDGFLLDELPVDGANGFTLFFVYDKVDDERPITVAANTALDDLQNTGGIGFFMTTSGGNSYLYSGARTTDGIPPASEQRSRVKPFGFQYDAFGYNVNSKEYFISNRYPGQAGTGFSDGTIGDIDPSQNNNSFYVFRGAETARQSSTRNDRIALVGWYPRMLTQQENNDLAAALIPFMDDLGVDLTDVSNTL